MILIIALTFCSLFSGMTHVLVVSGVKAKPIVTEECQGDACGLITITWDTEKEQYKVQNNSTDKWVRVDAANLVSSANLCLAPAKSDYLSLPSVVGAIRAAQAQESCGKKI